MMNMRSFTSVFLIFLMLHSVSCSTDNSLGEHKTVQAIFAKQEVQELTKILDFFTNQISEITGEKDPELTFRTFMDSVKETSPISGVLPVLCTKKEQDLFFESLDPAFFKEIWRYDRIYGGEDGAHWRALELKFDGKYVQFLKLLGEVEAIIHKYYADFRMSGSIGASLQASVMLLPEKYDVSDPAIRLVIAIHYLTICYQY
jgi:hypothetical protein